MLRSMFQIYVTDSVAAAKMYQQAFDTVMSVEYKDGDGGYAHAEMEICGQTLAICEAFPDDGARVAGTTMQFCLHMGEGGEEFVKRAYSVLSDGADVHTPLGEINFSPLMFGLVDRYGVNWCVYV